MDASTPDTGTSGDATPLSDGDHAGTTSTLPAPAPEPQGLQFTVRPSDLIEIGANLFQDAEALLRTGRKRRLKVRLGRKTLVEMPLATGAVGVILAAMVAVALTRLTVELE